MTTPGNYNTDMSDMIAIHRALVASFDAARVHVGGAGNDRGRVAVVASFFENVIEFLRVHHTGEDELIYPLLEERCAESRAELARIDAQHQLLHPVMEAGRSAVAAWRTEPSPGRAQAVIDAMTSIRATLAPHLTDEEATVVPLAAKWLTPEEIGRLGGHGMMIFRGDKPWIMLGLMREQLDEAHGIRLLEHMPPKMRTMWLEQMEPAYRAFVGDVRQ